MGDALQRLGVGLSRILRYSYGGFLLFTLVTLVNSAFTKPIREAMGWELLSLALVIIGAGVYAVHRNVIVPLHHTIMCALWWLHDGLTKRTKGTSANPTRWLGSLSPAVPLLWRIPAYGILRRSELFGEQREDWNIAHAEQGLVLMTAEACAVAAVYATSQAQPGVGPAALFWAAGIIGAFSFAGFAQHALECHYFKAKEGEVLTVLQDIGILARLEGKAEAVAAPVSTDATHAA